MENVNPTSSRVESASKKASIRELFENWYETHRARTPQISSIKGFLFVSFLTGMSLAWAFAQDEENTNRLKKEMFDLHGFLNGGVQ